MSGLAITLTKWNDWMEVNGEMTCKPKLPLLFSSHDDLRYSVSPGSCHPLWHRSHRRKSHIWHRRSHGLCDRPWRTLCTHLPHPPSYRCDSGTWRMKRNKTRLCIYIRSFLRYVSHTVCRIVKAQSCLLYLELWTLTCFTYLLWGKPSTFVLHGLNVQVDHYEKQTIADFI